MKNQQQKLCTRCGIRLLSRNLIIVLLLGFSTPLNCFIQSVAKPLKSQTLKEKITLSILPKRYKESQLNANWFGIADTIADNNNDTSESIDITIKRPTSNSRLISGSIMVRRPVDDVWAILTDYDNLSIHVPNLVESRQVNPSLESISEPGDGTYTCRLYQKGAQKIIGFDFVASVTMDMTEDIHKKDTPSELRQIGFKCVESQFFSEFDGYWKVTPSTDPADPTQVYSNVEYIVLVKPKGPVPVAALEWRIREDIPINLKAVKHASIKLGREGVQELRQTIRTERNGLPGRSIDMRRQFGRLTSAASETSKNVGDKLGTAVMNATSARQDRQLTPRLAPVRVRWEDDETMAKYLKNKRS